MHMASSLLSEYEGKCQCMLAKFSKNSIFNRYC